MSEITGEDILQRFNMAEKAKAGGLVGPGGSARTNLSWGNSAFPNISAANFSGGSGGSGGLGGVYGGPGGRGEGTQLQNVTIQNAYFSGFPPEYGKIFNIPQSEAARFSQQRVLHGADEFPDAGSGVMRSRRGWSSDLPLQTESGEWTGSSASQMRREVVQGGQRADISYSAPLLNHGFNEGAQANGRASLHSARGKKRRVAAQLKPKIEDNRECKPRRSPRLRAAAEVFYYSFERRIRALTPVVDLELEKRSVQRRHGAH
jgi:hypothetical protein